MTSKYIWPEDWAARRLGHGCPMCESLGTEDTLHGIRVFAGIWSDAYLGRYPVRRGYSYVIWNGRHVSEPTELSHQESIGFWSEVARVSRAVELRYQPAKMNWLHLGNGVPHLHIHLVPRPPDDFRAGAPIEAEAFEHEHQQPLSDDDADAEATALRAVIAQGTS